MATKKSKTGKIVIVRTYSAGVNVGELVSRSADGTQAVLLGSHKIYRWRGANTLHELARVGASMTEYTRISEAAPGEVALVGVIEILDTTPEAAANLRSPRWL